MKTIFNLLKTESGGGVGMQEVSTVNSRPTFSPMTVFLMSKQVCITQIRGSNEFVPFLHLHSSCRQCL